MGEPPYQGAAEDISDGFLGSACFGSDCFGCACSGFGCSGSDCFDYSGCYCSGCCCFDYCSDWPWFYLSILHLPIAGTSITDMADALFRQNCPNR
jgi:hypothetical protein